MYAGRHCPNISKFGMADTSMYTHLCATCAICLHPAFLYLVFLLSSSLLLQLPCLPIVGHDHSVCVVIPFIYLKLSIPVHDSSSSIYIASTLFPMSFLYGITTSLLPPYCSPGHSSMASLFLCYLLIVPHVIPLWPHYSSVTSLLFPMSFPSELTTPLLPPYYSPCHSPLNSQLLCYLFIVSHIFSLWPHYSSVTYLSFLVSFPSEFKIPMLPLYCFPCHSLLTSLFPCYLLIIPQVITLWTDISYDTSLLSLMLYTFHLTLFGLIRFFCINVIQLCLSLNEKCQHHQLAPPKQTECDALVSVHSKQRCSEYQPFIPGIRDSAISTQHWINLAYPALEPVLHTQHESSLALPSMRPA